MFKKSGFTLAEVLITLGIIGVVAAMTIPTLLNQTNDAEYKTGLKKAISSLNQAITMNVALEGTDFSSLNGGTTGDTNSIYYMFTHRMNVVSTVAGTNEILGDNFEVTGNYILFLSDGIAISFPTDAAGCTTATQDGCHMVVDVNGLKKPNTTSLATTTTGVIRDQFFLDFYNQRIDPQDESARYVLFN